MSTHEKIFLIITCILYVSVIIAYGRRKTRSKAVFILLPIALVTHLISVAIRWIQAGHPPVFGTYEATLAASWFLLLTAFLAVKRHREAVLLIPLTAFFALLHVAYGLTFNVEHIPLTISEQSIWVDLHALAAWLAYGELSISFLLASLLLLQRAEWFPKSGFFEHSLSMEILDELVFKYLVLGFLFHTAMFALGSYYSSILFGKWWTWDPVDSLFLLSWFIFAIIIHLRLFYGWKGERMAKLVLIGMAALLISYWSLVYIPWATYHIFDIDLKLHG